MEPKGAERRREERLAPPGVGMLDVYRVAGFSRKFLGRTLLVDGSRSGLGIQMDVTMSPGDIVELSNRYVTYEAIVRNCRPELSGYRLGLQLRGVHYANPSDAPRENKAIGGQKARR